MSSNSTETAPEIDRIVSFDVGNDDDDGPAPAPAAQVIEVKRGRGRPPKNGLDKLAQMASSAPPSGGVPQEEEGDEARTERRAKQAKIQVIERLQKQLGAVGTGMRPTMFDSLSDLDNEIDALNADLNVKRGDKAVKKFTLLLMPLIEMASDLLVPKDKLDLSSFRHLKDEVEDNWELFEEAVQHIAILHSEWFAVTPYHELASATASCAMSTNAKNQAIKKRGIAGATTTSAPQNTPESDDESTTGDEDEDDK